MGRCARCGAGLEDEPAGLCAKCLVDETVGPDSSLGELKALLLQPPPTAAKGHAPAWWSPGTLLSGRYMVLSELGHGGMSVVLAAYDTRLDRRVAIKLLHPGRPCGDGELKARMEREARAMARLNHPHVVQVYDSGYLEDGSFFISMEYVEGQTLRGWCQTRRCSWREVLEVYLAAGRGLAAAHAAGLIHRDFKPDNVLVGRDGRVRVTDFGLARFELSELPAPEHEQLATPPPDAWKSPLTHSGWLLGTPLYMAPELLRSRGTADVRSDLFSFCVSLHESLHGRLPFGESACLRDLLDRRLTPPPQGSPVPGWVTRVLYQGLREDPRQRPASMEELLAALEADPEQRHRARRLAVPLALGALLLLPLASWSWGHLREPGCDLQAERLAGVWDGKVKARVEKALLGTGLPYARDTAGRVSTLLDDYARTWVGMRTAVCAEVRAQPGVPEGRTLLEEHCLERRLGQMRAVTELLARGPEAGLLPKAVEVVQALPPLEDCRSERVLADGGLPSGSPELQVKVMRLQGELDRLPPLYAAGRYQEGLELYEKLRRELESVEHAPLRAQALGWRARFEQAVGSYEKAGESAQQAVRLSARGGDVTQSSLAWNMLALVKGVRQGRYQLSEMLLMDEMLESMTELSRDDRVRIESLMTRGSMLYGQGKYEEARERQERALALAEAVLKPEHHAVPDLLNNLGLTYKALGRYEEARHCYERALALRQQLFGSEHPQVASSLSNLGALLAAEGRHEEARARHEQALAMMERVLTPAHPNITLALNSLAGEFQTLGQYEEAAARFEQVRLRLEKQFGAESPMGIIVHINLCSVLVDLGRYEEARAKCERALALGEKTGSKNHLGFVHHYLGRVFAGRNQHARARMKYERSLALLEETLGPKHPECVPPLLGLAELHLARGRPTQALALLERAMDIASPFWRAEVRFPLARALWESGKDRMRSRELATEALLHYQRLGHPKRHELERWLAAHPLP